MTDPKPLPCKRCGGRYEPLICLDTVTGDPEEWYIACPCDLKELPRRSTREEAIAAWNAAQRGGDE